MSYCIKRLLDLTWLGLKSQHLVKIARSGYTLITTTTTTTTTTTNDKFTLP